MDETQLISKYAKDLIKGGACMMQHNGCYTLFKFLPLVQIR